jgi:hypothetical protein
MKALLRFLESSNNQFQFLLAASADAADKATKIDVHSALWNAMFRKAECG